MLNQELLDYVRQQIAAGVSQKDVTKTLMTGGWTKQDADAVFEVLPHPVAQSNRKGINISLLFGVLATLVLVGGSAFYFVFQAYFGKPTERIFCGSTAPPVYCAWYRCTTGFSVFWSSPPPLPPKCTDGSIPINLGQVPQP
ncbi:MAG: hypothetical protein ACYC75_01580 [Minisyncoccota bacterium]